MDWNELFIPLVECGHCGGAAMRAVRWRVLPAGIGRLFAAEVGCSDRACPFRASYETVVLDREDASLAVGGMVLGMSRAWNENALALARERAETFSR